MFLITTDGCVVILGWVTVFQKAKGGEIGVVAPFSRWSFLIPRRLAESDSRLADVRRDINGVLH